MRTFAREYGHFEHTTNRRAISEMLVRFAPLDLVAHWGRCGMTADYMADFLAYTFENAEIAKNIISTVLNELVENIAKFSPEKRREVIVSLCHYGDVLCMTTENSTNTSRAESLTSFVEKLMSEDIDTLFLRQIEHTAASGAPASGLGMLTLIKDYKARLGVRITPRPDTKYFDVLMQVTLDVEQMERMDAIDDMTPKSAASPRSTAAPRSVMAKASKRFDPGMVPAVPPR